MLTKSSDFLVQCQLEHKQLNSFLHKIPVKWHREDHENLKQGVNNKKMCIGHMLWKIYAMCGYTEKKNRLRDFYATKSQQFPALSSLCSNKSNGKEAWLKSGVGKELKAKEQLGREKGFLWQGPEQKWHSPTGCPMARMLCKLLKSLHASISNKFTLPGAWRIQDEQILSISKGEGI